MDTQTDRHTHTDMDKSTYRKEGRCFEKFIWGDHFFRPPSIKKIVSPKKIYIYIIQNVSYKM